MLETESLRDITVTDIARAADTSPATFYVYFANVSSALLAASREISQSTPEVMAVVLRDWDRSNARELAVRLVREYVAFWGLHRPLFRARNLAAEEGDTDFIDARAGSVRPLLEALAAKIATMRDDADDGDRPTPLATAGAILMMLERLGALTPEHRRHPPGHDELVDAAAEMICATMRL